MNSVLSHFSQFQFIRPEFLFALIPAVFLVILLWFRKPNYGAWHHVISSHLLPHLLQGTVKQQGKMPLILLLLGWIMASVALAGPTWSKLPQTVQKKINARVILLDLSLSMLAEDIKPSRLGRAHHKLKDILDQSNEGLTGLIVYAGTSHVVSPLTDDTHTILSMIMSLSPEIMPIKGSDPVGAIEKAAKLLQQAGVSEGQLLLITDEVPTNFVSDVKQFINPSLTPVSIFAIGTTEGAPIPLSQGSFVKNAAGSIIVPKLNTQQLKANAKALNGRFSTLSSDDEDINYLMGNSTRLLNDEMKDTNRDFDTWDESGLGLVLLLLPLAAFANRKGWLGILMLPTLLTLFPTPSAQASPWDDLWSTKDQQAQSAWDKNNLGTAAELFADPAWKASAEYKNKDYEASAATLKQHIATERDITADNHYNLGNALSQLQDFPGALEAYDKALSLDPAMADAKNNQALVKKIQEQQEQEQQDGDGEKKDVDKQENDEKKDSDQKDSEQDPSNDEDQKNQQEQDDKQQDSEQQTSSKEQQDEKQQEEQEQQSSQQKEDEENKEKQDQQQEDESKDDTQEPQQTRQDIQESNLDKEEEQALEQWLRRIPDDPGGLLRRKFAQESKLRRNQPVEDKQW